MPAKGKKICSLPIRSILISAAATISVAVCGVAQAAPPAVSTGTLVAQFDATDSTVARDGSGNVTSWTASNNSSIVLNTSGSDPANIKYNATGMFGAPTIVVNDFAGDTQTMSGVIPGARTATTIFWLGYYQPSRDGSLNDAVGQYAYTYGADGTDGHLLDNQIDSGFVELYSGSGTQAGGSIAARNGIYTVWRTNYGTGSGNGHAVFADGTNLGVSSPNGGNYSIANNSTFRLFGFTDQQFNYVGNMSELLIYDGILDATDTAAVEAYLSNQIPEPGSTMIVLCAAGLLLRNRRVRNFCR